MKYQFTNTTITAMIKGNILSELKKISGIISINNVIDIDLDNIVSIDSAGIALFIELKNIAACQSKRLNFLNPTPDILRLCQLYRVNINN